MQFRLSICLALATLWTFAFAQAAEDPSEAGSRTDLTGKSAHPTESAVEVKPPTEGQVKFFETRIRPILVEHCQQCHGMDKQKGNFRLDSAAGLRAGGDLGPAITSGAPEESLMLRAIGYQDETLKMPPRGKLSDRQIADLTEWIKAGAPYPARQAPAAKPQVPSKSENAEGDRFWAFQPPVKASVPIVRDALWPRNVVDRFILAGLEAKGLKPAPPADKRTLIRRATFDLLGLPPTVAEVEAFLADDSPAAYTAVIERLLASPHYGERWGRHWLDVVRYADSNGLDENIAFGNAWRYRDYVAAAFNRDKPYDQFLREQIAGDLLPPVDDMEVRHERLIATAFLSLGPKVLAEVDERKMEMDIIDEQVDTLGRALLGLTLGCARCHDHKFDPISTEDYYAVAGIFKSTRTMEHFKKIARWNENDIAVPADLARKAAHEQRVAEKSAAVDGFIKQANARLQASQPGAALPEKPESQYSDEDKARLKQLRDELAAAGKEAPVMPTALGVGEGAIADLPVHIRGNHLTLGNVVPRGVPRILAGSQPPAIEPNHSGRLELAEWLVRKDHPLTSRVMINRLWRWHFGEGLVRSPDNFGKLGEAPTNQPLLDWLARDFIESGWSIKHMHRQLMLSSTYQMTAVMAGHPAPVVAGLLTEPHLSTPVVAGLLTEPHVSTEGLLSRATDAVQPAPHESLSQAASIDPANHLLWRMNVQRLEAEEIHDALLAASGGLDRTMGGSLLHVANRGYLFDHTSLDHTRYDAPRRALYLPVIRNNLYDVFQLFDAPDGTVLNGNRDSTTVAPQALFMLNSDLVQQSANRLAKSLLALPEADDARRIEILYLQCYSRPPSDTELVRDRGLLERFYATALTSESDPAARRMLAWTWLCHGVLAANEFIYVR